MIVFPSGTHHLGLTARGAIVGSRLQHLDSDVPEGRMNPDG
jgi:hypothetical protein